MAHEINNPLAIIKANISLAKSMIHAGGMTPEKLSGILTSVDSALSRVVTIVDGLKVFGRDGSHDDFEHADLCKIIEDTLIFCAEKFKNHCIQLNVNGVSKAMTVKCRPVQISQVILNLLNNAYDAVENVENRTIEIQLSESSKHVKIQITDNGLGVPDEIKTKIFKPFITTKPVGKGTGLGLSIAKGIMDSHSGDLFLEKKDIKTCFTIRLPKN